MTLTAAERKEAARELAVKLYVAVQKTAVTNIDDLIAAVGSIDDAMDTTFDNLPAAWGTKTVKQGLIDNLPDPFKSNSSAADKAIAMSIWAMKEAGLI